MPKLILGLGAGLLLLLAGLALWLDRSTASPAKQENPIQEVNATAGAIYAARFMDSQGVEQELAQWQHRLLVINFWATWCAPCMEELPYFSELKKNKPEIRVVMVNLDFNQDVHRKVLPLLAKYKDCEVVRITGLNADDWMPLVDADWSGAIPATTFIQGSERIFVDTKFNSYSELHQIVHSKN